MSLQKDLICLFSLSFVYALVVFFLKVSDPFILWCFQTGYLLLPAVVGVAINYQRLPKLHIFRWKSVWFSLSLLMPTAFIVLSMVISYLIEPFAADLELRPVLFQTVTSSNSLNWFLFILYTYIAGTLGALCLNFFILLGEEVFWRGILYEKIRCLGFVKHSLVIGFVWGLRQIPAVCFLGYMYSENLYLGSVYILLFSLLLSPIFSYLRTKSESVAPSCIFYAMMLAFAPATFLVYLEPNEFLVTSIGLSGLFCLLVINLFLWPQYRKLNERSLEIV